MSLIYSYIKKRVYKQLARIDFGGVNRTDGGVKSGSLLGRFASILGHYTSRCFAKGISAVVVGMVLVDTEASCDACLYTFQRTKLRRIGALLLCGDCQRLEEGLANAE